MKKIMICCSILFSLLKIDVSAQICVSGQYYDYRYQVEDIPVSQSIQKYDIYGRYLGIYQWWQRAEWHSSSGGQYVYVWNGGQWVYQLLSGSYYWYTWVRYERFIEY